MPQILVVDEHGIYRTGLCHLLRAGLPRADVLDANDLDGALSQIRNRVFDLVLVHPGQSGLGTLDILKTARKASHRHASPSFPHPTLAQIFSPLWRLDFAALFQNTNRTPKFSLP